LVKFIVVVDLSIHLTNLDCNKYRCGMRQFVPRKYLDLVQMLDCYCHIRVIITFYFLINLFNFLTLQLQKF